MQKAHLYEAIFLVNQGIDQTVRGLACLKEAAGIGEEIYGDTLVTLEKTRSQANSQFLLDMQQLEGRDAERYEQIISETERSRSPREAIEAYENRIRGESKGKGLSKHG